MTQCDPTPVRLYADLSAPAEERKGRSRRSSSLGYIGGDMLRCALPLVLYEVGRKVGDPPKVVSGGCEGMYRGLVQCDLVEAHHRWVKQTSEGGLGQQTLCMGRCCEAVNEELPNGSQCGAPPARKCVIAPLLVLPRCIIVTRRLADAPCGD